MGNGLRFNSSTRTITGTPTDGASPVIYTYTVTDNGGRTAQLTFIVTVFNVSIEVEDKNLKDVHWGVLAYSKARVIDPIHRTEYYQFKVGIPASAGFQLGKECTWPVASPASTATLWIDWVLLNNPLSTFDLVRCGLGSGGPVNIGMKVRIQDEIGQGSDFSITNVTIPQSWHRADHQVDYYIMGSQTSSIQAVTTTSSVGLFSSRKPHLAHHAVSPALLSLTNYADAAQAWNDVKAGVTVNRMSTAGGADVVIRGYWNEDPGGARKKDPAGNEIPFDDGICGESIACTLPAGTYPHNGNQQPFWIEDRPHWGERPPKKNGPLISTPQCVNRTYCNTCLRSSCMSSGTPSVWATLRDGRTS